MAKQFEYKVQRITGNIITELDSYLNELGKAGWELVTVLKSGEGFGPTALVFKKEIENG